MATPAELTAAENALQTYVDDQLEAMGKGWEEMFIPQSAFDTGAQDAITAADASPDQSVAGREKAADTALRAAINATGEGNQVSDQVLDGGAAAVLAAVAKVRAGAS